MLEELGIGYMAFSPLANGLLSEQYQAGCAFAKASRTADKELFIASGYRPF